MRIGIDVGGTNTDAVLIEGRRIVSWTKAPTTRDVSGGITPALSTLLAQSQVAPAQVEAVMLGTTHFTNAVVERRSLSPTAVVRIGLPATAALPPFTDWPEDLRAAIGGQAYLAHGGFEFNGKPIAPLDEVEIGEIATRIRDAGITSIAVSSVFSPVNPEQETLVAALLTERIPRARISLSHEIGRIGLLERENAAAMNACLSELAGDIVRSFRSALADLGLRAPFFVTQNDGTLMSAAQVEKYPVLTFASGPTNSMRGAAFLSGVKDGVVVDVGGTTSDVGVLVHGFPREASVAVRIGGVRTNFRMPDVFSFGLGGGSHVRPEPLAIGPQSVGYEITSRALVFGGSDLTATDVAVAAGMASVGDHRKVAHLDRALVPAAIARMQEMVESAVDRMKTGGGDVPVVLVGGGILLIGDRLRGVSELVRPDHAPVANAIGAAIAQVGGEVDRVVSLDATPRDKALEEAKALAAARVVSEGALPASVEIVDVEEIPLSYLPGNATRIRVKAVGDLPVDAVKEGR
jgi:N-methylhydantoinase A/oxoprolinase/acetone carboxylase beta subunit